MARKTKEDAEKTRVLILETALEVFYERGYSRATLVDIAKKIDMTKGAIYWHFKSKVDVFLGLGAFMEEKLEASLADLFTHPRGIDDIRHLPVRLIKLVAEDAQLNKYYSLIYYRMEWQDELLPLKDFFIRQDEEFKQYAEVLFQKAQENGDVKSTFSVASMAITWLALIDGFMARILMEKETVETLLVDLEFGINIYIAGLK